MPIGNPLSDVGFTGVPISRAACLPMKPLGSQKPSCTRVRATKSSMERPDTQPGGSCTGSDDFFGDLLKSFFHTVWSPIWIYEQVAQVIYERITRQHYQWPRQSSRDRERSKMNRLLSLIRSLLTIQRKNSENDQPLSSEEETFVSEVVAAGRRRIGSEVQMHLMADRYLNTAHIILRLKDDPASYCWNSYNLRTGAKQNFDFNRLRPFIMFRLQHEAI